MLRNSMPNLPAGEWEARVAQAHFWFNRATAEERKTFAARVRLKVEELDRFFAPYRVMSSQLDIDTSLLNVVGEHEQSAEQEKRSTQPKRTKKPANQGKSDRSAEAVMGMLADVNISVRKLRDQSREPRAVQKQVAAGASLAHINPFNRKFCVQARPESTKPSHMKPQYDPNVHTHYAAWIRQFSKMLMDVLTGNRNLRVLENVCSPEALRMLRMRTRLEHSYYGQNPVLVNQIRVHSLHAYPTGSGPYGFNNIEAAVVVQVGARFRAIALNVIAKDGRWFPESIEIG